MSEGPGGDEGAPDEGRNSANGTDENPDRPEQPDDGVHEDAVATDGEELPPAEADGGSGPDEDDGDETPFTGETPAPTPAETEPVAAGTGAGAGAGAGGGVGTGGAPDDQEMPLTVHIEEMIKRLAVVLGVMAVVSAVTFPFADSLINFLWHSFLPGSVAACESVAAAAGNATLFADATLRNGTRLVTTFPNGTVVNGTVVPVTNGSVAGAGTNLTVPAEAVYNATVNGTEVSGRVVERTTVPLNVTDITDSSAACPRVYNPLSLVFARLKTASLAGFVVALPVFVYETYRFMRPGLYPNERRYYLSSVPTSLVLAGVGIAFAYFLVLPVIFTYFLGYSQPVADIAFGLSDTFDLILLMLGMFAFIFQIPLFVMLAILMGVTSRRWLESRRLYFWFGFAGIAFLFSPDPTGMAPFIVALTMVLLFEGTLLLLRWTGR